MKYGDGSVAEVHLDYLSHKYLRGGQVIACGTPEEVAATPGSFTGVYLESILNRERAFELIGTRSS